MCKHCVLLLVSAQDDVTVLLLGSDTTSPALSDQEPSLWLSRPPCPSQVISWHILTGPHFLYVQHFLNFVNVPLPLAVFDFTQCHRLPSSLHEEVMPAFRVLLCMVFL